MTDLDRTEPAQASITRDADRAPRGVNGVLSAYDASGPVASRSQRQRVIRKFLRHRLAVAGLGCLGLIFVASMTAGAIAPYPYDEVDLSRASIPPTFENLHFFGTDKLGRDYFSRTLHGTGTSVIVALVVALLSTVLGTTIGSVAGYVGGLVDTVVMRIVDLMLTLPGIAVLLVLTALVGRGSPVTIGVILSLLFWVALARIVRASVLGVREEAYVDAARAAGASHLWILSRHILPNVVAPIIVYATLLVAIAIQTEAALSFLGFGIKAPDPALGKLIQEGRNSMLTDWWLVVMPGMVIVVVSLAVNFVGDGLRDALDPHQREIMVVQA